MDYTQVNHGKRSEVFLRGQFTFFDTTVFTRIRDLFVASGAQTLVLNFRDIDFIDSAALGMLLLAREEIEKLGLALILASPSRVVEKAFRISAFDTLFQIEV